MVHGVGKWGRPTHCTHMIYAPVRCLRKPTSWLSLWRIMVKWRFVLFTFVDYSLLDLVVRCKGRDLTRIDVQDTVVAGLQGGIRNSLGGFSREFVCKMFTDRGNRPNRRKRSTSMGADSAPAFHHVPAIQCHVLDSNLSLALHEV